MTSVVVSEPVSVGVLPAGPAPVLPAPVAVQLPIQGLAMTMAAPTRGVQEMHYAARTAAPPVAQDVGSVLEQYLLAFVAQDVGRISDFFDESAHVRVFNDATGVKEEFAGPAQISSFYAQLFKDLHDLSTFNTQVVDVDEDAGQVLMVWKCPSSGILAATSTLIYDRNFKIWKQNTVHTRMPGRHSKPAGTYAAPRGAAPSAPEVPRHAFFPLELPPIDISPTVAAVKYSEPRPVMDLNAEELVNIANNLRVPNALERLINERM